MAKKQTVEKAIRIVPLNDAQKEYVSILNGPSSVIICTGQAGVGKSLLACYAGIHGVYNGRYEKLIVTRPVVESGEKLGYLPGDLQEKIAPYITPIMDACSFSGNEWTKIKHFVEIAPLAYLRGRTLRNAFIIADEMQNATMEQMLMLLTRLGDRSKLVINGDPEQSDLIKIKQGALWHAIDTLSDVEGVESFEFPDNASVRNPIINKILKAWNS